MQPACKRPHNNKSSQPLPNPTTQATNQKQMAAAPDDLARRHILVPAVRLRVGAWPRPRPAQIPLHQVVVCTAGR